MALIATAAAVSLTPAGAQAAVCNQASAGQRGDLVATEPSTRPPARHTTDLKAVPGKGAGIATAAERSPALNMCGTVQDDGGDDGGSGGILLPGGDIAN